MLSLTAKKCALLLSIAITTLNLWAQQISLPRTPSPAATVSQTIGISTVTVQYSRPAVNGREVWGNLVPYGWNKQGFGGNNEAPWRAGANENTTISFSHDVELEGKKIPAGTYGLFYVINKDNTGEVILSKDYRSWGSFWYNPEQDALRANIQVREAPMTERLTYEFDSLTKNSAELLLSWEKKQFPVKIQFAVDELVLANAEEELKGTTGFTWQGYSSAANYALQNKLHTDKALRWIDQAVTQDRNFTTLSIKSGLLKETGKEAEADKLMKDALAVATENELNNYGYQLLGSGQVDKAIEMFKLNTQRHPQSANTWDSLGEGYAIKGDKKNAIANFKKSLSMNPPPNVKANSEKYLKQLGAM